MPTGTESSAVASPFSGTSAFPVATTLLESTAPTPKKAGGLALAALIVSIIAFLTGLVPVLGAILGVSAIALGIFALVRGQSKGFAVTALILAGIASISSIAITAGLASAVGGSSETPSSAVETSGPVTEPSSTPEPSTESAEAQEEAPEEPPAETGSASNPLPQPYTATGLFGGEKYSLTAKVINASANGQMNEWNMFNSEAPAGFKYVVAEMTMTGIDPDGVEPSLATFDLYLATSEGNRYDAEYVIFGEGMPAMSDGPTLYPGNSFTGYSAYIVPESASTFLLYDNSNYVALPQG